MIFSLIQPHKWKFPQQYPEPFIKKWIYILNNTFSETAMGKKIYAQSNSESEYVKSVYKWVLIVFSITQIQTIIRE